MKRVLDVDEFKKKPEEMALSLSYMNFTQYETHWTEMEEMVKTLMAQAKAEATK